MLANFFNDRRLQEHFRLTFSYRLTPDYVEGLRKRLPPLPQEQALSLLAEAQPSRLAARLPRALSLPLGFLLEFADRWMLQSWGGANEQAYFSISQQFSAIALLATASVMNILWKEVAEAHHQQDANRVKMLYQRASPTGKYLINY